MDRLSYDNDMDDDDEMMEDSETADDDADESVEDYFGMSPDWYVASPYVRVYIERARAESSNLLSCSLAHSLSMCWGDRREDGA